MNYYSVIVGNVGTVYEGVNGFTAYQTYDEYVGLSKRNTGRCAGEDVTLFNNNEIEREYIGTLNRED